MAGLPPGIHPGHGGHNTGILMGGRRTENKTWAEAAPSQGLHGLPHSTDCDQGLHSTATEKTPREHHAVWHEDQAKQVQKHLHCQGGLSDHCMYIGDEPIPKITEKPVKSLGRWYDASLKDKK